MSPVPPAPARAGGTPTTARGERLERDRVTYLVFAFIAVHGYFLFAFNTSTGSLLREDLGISRAVAGLHGTTFAVGVVLAGLTTARLSERLGRARVLQLGASTLMVAVVLYCTTELLPVTLLAGALGGAGGSYIANAHATVLTDHHPGSGGPASITEANAIGAGIGLLAPLALGAAAGTVLGWRAGVWVLIPFAVLVVVLSTRVHLPDTPRRRALALARSREGEAVVPDATPSGEGPPVDGTADSPPEQVAVPVKPLPKRYWAAWLALLLCIGGEFSLTIWSGDLLVQQHGLDAAEGARGVTALILGMALGRWVGGRLALRIPVERFFLAALGLAVAGVLVTWASPNVAIGYAGLLLTGLGIAMHFPLGISRAIRDSGGQPDRAVALTGVGVGCAIGVAPFMLGAAADQVGTRTAFLIIPLLFAGAAVAVWLRRPLMR